MSCSSSSSGTPMIRMLACLKLSWRFLSLSSLFFKLFFLHSVLVECFFLPSVPNHWFESWFPSLHCLFPVHFSLFHFVKPSLLSLFVSIPNLSILVTSVLNSASDRLAISSFHRFFFLEFGSVLSFGPLFLCLGAPVNLVRGRALVFTTAGQPHFILWAVCGGGQRRNNTACKMLSCSALTPLSDTFPTTHYPQANWALWSAVLVLIPGWVGLCIF